MLSSLQTSHFLQKDTADWTKAVKAFRLSSLGRLFLSFGGLDGGGLCIHIETTCNQLTIKALNGLVRN